MGQTHCTSLAGKIHALLGTLPARYPGSSLMGSLHPPRQAFAPTIPSAWGAASPISVHETRLMLHRSWQMPLMSWNFFHTRVCDEPSQCGCYRPKNDSELAPRLRSTHSSQGKTQRQRRHRSPHGCQSSLLQGLSLHMQPALNRLGGTLSPPGSLPRSPLETDLWGPLCGFLASTRSYLLSCYLSLLSPSERHTHPRCRSPDPSSPSSPPPSSPPGPQHSCQLHLSLPSVGK